MAKKQKSLWEVFTAGFVKENPVLRLVIGTCPTLAVTTMAFNGVLQCSYFFIKKHYSG